MQVVEGFGKRWGIHGKRSLVLFMHTDTSAPAAWQCASDQASPAWRRLSRHKAFVI
ncbi:hypothetical protein CSC33_2153 [Pseudomonas aeruginosa]|nr:hypothetical protein CSC28_3456 [Pseudomonas paraeruginosa]AWQ87194.1 hypothetical protein CSC33_2153 [Pseudomonas aeruginosa]PTC35793.1 hypothetical protein CLJ1_3278 [Pseudomonas aeruginosa]